jgi:signal peptidase I
MSKKRSNAAPAKPPPPAAEEEAEGSASLLDILREWADALIIAFVLAMFVRVFIVELFKIPTGSMSPTLLGDYIAEVDRDDDGLTDLVVKGGNHVLVFLNKGDRMEYSRVASEQVTGEDLRRWDREGLLRPEYDRILVNKFAYWRKNPERGDVVVFKVPDPIWDPLKPIYIKRAVGLPGDEVTFQQGRLAVQGRTVEEPAFFKHQIYEYVLNPNTGGFHEFDYFKYRPRQHRLTELAEIKVPEDGLLVLGDNTHHSLDSRYWGAVPLENLKGKAFLRYWPWRKIKFIR